MGGVQGETQKVESQSSQEWKRIVGSAREQRIKDKGKEVGIGKRDHEREKESEERPE